MDPRASLIPERISGIKRIISVVSGKGGVGKSLISAMMSIFLSEKGFETGLLDLDIHGSTCHTILGVEEIEFVEEKGVIPPKVNGLKFMSPIVFSQQDLSLPLRGDEITDAILEILAITIWGKLDYLVIDMPPGLGEEILDLLKYMEKAEYLIVTTPSVLAIKVAERVIELLESSNKKIIGILGNMCRNGYEIEKMAQKRNIQLLGCLPFDPSVEEVIGDIQGLKETKLYRALSGSVEKILLDS